MKCFAGGMKYLITAVLEGVRESDRHVFAMWRDCVGDLGVQ